MFTMSSMCERGALNRLSETGVSLRYFCTALQADNNQIMFPGYKDTGIAVLFKRERKIYGLETEWWVRERTSENVYQGFQQSTILTCEKSKM